MRIQHPQTKPQSLKGNEAAQSTKAAEATKKDKEKGESKATRAEGSSIAQISLKAKEMAQAKAAAAQAPEVREERIAELRKRIQNKEYSVDPEAIADRMLREHSEL